MTTLPSFQLFVPESVDALAEFLNENGEKATLIGSGSDLIPRITRKQLKPGLLVDLSGLDELRYIRNDDDCVRIGALTTISELTENKLIRKKYVAFLQVADLFGAPPIRNIATIGGNIAAASSSEDLIPVLLALDANVVLRSVNGTRTVPLEKFIVGKRKTDRRPNEVITEVSFTDIPENSCCTFEKIGRRATLIIALVSLATYLQLEKDSKKIENIRIALNRLSVKTPQRARRTEEELLGKICSEEVVEKSLNILSQELQLTSDYRASARYRTEIAKTFLKRAVSQCADMILEKPSFNVA